MAQIISGKIARELIETKEAQLVDVRNPDEFGRDALPGAINIPVHMIPVTAREHLDTSKPVVVYCLSGGRSAQAQMILNSLGFNDVHNVISPMNFLNS